MKIFFILPEIVNCGPVNVVLNLAIEFLKNHRNSVSIVSIRSNDNNYINEFQSIGVKSFYSLGNRDKFFDKVLYLKKVTKDADVIHTHGFYPDFYSAFFVSNNIRKVSTAHCLFFKDYQLEYGDIKGFIYALLHHMVYRFSSFDMIVGCSKSVTNSLKKLSFLSNNRLTTIHNGVNRDRFVEKIEFDKSVLKSSLISKYNLKVTREAAIFIYTGRIIRRKKVYEMIEWFLKTQSPSNILIIVGEGEEMGLCKETAKSNKNILFTGFTDNVIPFYQISDYLLSFSSFEGFPMSVLEGLSCGCKAILSDIPSHREVVQIYPTMATLINNFSIEHSSFSWSEDSTHYLSSIRMAEAYKIIYKSESK